MRTSLSAVLSLIIAASGALTAAACDETSKASAASVFIPVNPPVSSVSPSIDTLQLTGAHSASSAPKMLVSQVQKDAGGADILAQSAVQTAQIEIADQTNAAQGADKDAWARILARYTSAGMDGLVRFDYGALKASSADMSGLASYLSKQSTRTPSKMGRAEAMSYWANVYNALTIQVVTQNYPVRSIRDIKSGRRKGPWKRELITVEGKVLSLDNIEHDILRPQFQTPLVHYMVNCASIGCPNLKTSPWHAATLDEDLDKAARAYINSPRGVHFSKNQVKVSRIYNWFKKDFGTSNSKVLEHLKQYANADLYAKLEGRAKIDKYAYDWALNAP